LDIKYDEPPEYYEGYLDLILQFYAKNAFKNKGWTAIAIDVGKGKVIYKRWKTDEDV